MAKNLLLAAAGGSAKKVYIEDVFSTYLYDGNGSSQTITNGIDLSGKGGLVWEKQRSTTGNHFLIDSARGVENSLASNTTAAQASGTTATFNSDGYSYATSWGSGLPIASWTFRKQAKFFDVVTYSGSSSTQNISHNLGSVPGCIIIKRTNNIEDWFVYHRSLGNTKYLKLNATTAEASGFAAWNDTSPTSTQFTVLGGRTEVNASGSTYVAYLFAHDAGGFGNAGDQSVIKCGSFAATSGTFVDLGWEPQWLLVKNTVSVNSWSITDNMRGVVTGGNDHYLLANTSDAEVASDVFDFSATGFTVKFTASNDNYIYIAIRRGPMKTPTDATKIFMPTVYTGTNADNRLINTTIAPDMVMIRQRNDTVVSGMFIGARLTGQECLLPGSLAATVDADSFDTQIVSSVEYGNAFSSMSGVWVGNDATRKFNINTTSNNHVIHAFKRAPGFFDVVCYTGTGANRTISHNLGVAPEMMIIKERNATDSAAVYHASVGNTKYLDLAGTAVPATSSVFWNDTTPTSSVFSLGTSGVVNQNGNTYIAFLFASCPGVSKVGTFTGSGNVDCGFANGARYILIKKTSGTAEDSTWSWHVFDTARGIVAASDPVLWLNETTAESTTGDYVDPLNAGFSTTAYWSGDFIYLAIA